MPPWSLKRWSFLAYIGVLTRLIMLGGLSLNWMWGLTAVMAIGMAGIGFSITHDALHGAYSSNQHVNNFVGLFFDLGGGQCIHMKNNP